MGLILSMLSLTLSGALYASETADPADVRDQVAQLTAVFAQHVFRLDRDMVTFHYEHDQDFNPTTTQQIAERFLRARSFFVPEIGDYNNEGPGIYVSVDPVGSRSFGGSSNTQLYVFTIKAGAKLLNTTQTLSSRELVNLTGISKTLRCGQYPDSRIENFGDAVAHFRDSGKICARAIIGAFTQLGVQGILYAYNASSSLDRCRLRDEAINVISPEIIDPASLAYFSWSTQLYQKPLAGEIKALYGEAVRDWKIQYGSSDLKTLLSTAPGLEQENVTRDEYLAWRDRTIYKCGPAWSTEPQKGKPNSAFFTQIFDRVLTRNYRDVEVQQALLDAKVAFENRVAEQNSSYARFDPMRMNIIDNLTYEAAGWPGDQSRMGTWKDARDAYYFGGRTMSVTSTLLNEPTITRRFQEGDARLIAARAPFVFLRPKQKQSDIYGEILRMAGFGERSRLIAMNDLLIDRGAAPILTRAAFVHLDQPDAAAAKQNRDLFLHVLAKCTAVYKDASIKLEDVNSGPCGLRQPKSFF